MNTGLLQKNTVVAMSGPAIEAGGAGQHPLQLALLRFSGLGGHQSLQCGQAYATRAANCGDRAIAIQPWVASATSEGHHVRRHRAC
jgi:hypothetical protein